MKQGTPEWFEARKGRVTASVAGAILGLSPHMTREDVMRAMVRDTLGAEPEFTGNVATQWGSAMEEEARVDYEMETGATIGECGFFTHDEWLGASPDGLIGGNYLVEIKCPYGIRKDAPPAFKAPEDQPHYMAQMQVQMYVTGRRWTFFYQWTPHGSRIDAIPYDPSWIVDNLPELRAFYDEYLEELKNPERHLEPLRKVIDTPQAHKMIEEWDELCEQEERTKERKKDLLEQMATMADGRNAEFAGRKLTLVKRAGSVSYAKALKELAPDANLSKWTGAPTESWRLS